MYALIMMVSLLARNGGPISISMTTLQDIKSYEDCDRMGQKYANENSGGYQRVDYTSLE
jgi:hypothetical protein